MRPQASPVSATGAGSRIGVSKYECRREFAPVTSTENGPNSRAERIRLRHPALRVIAWKHAMYSDT